jgi:predicted RNase H-like nuclease (RuvC/YqgF family)
MEETLKQILAELKGVKQGQSSLETRFGKLEERQTNLETGFSELKTSQANLETAFDEMKQSQIRMEKGQERFQKNLVDSLGTYTDKIIDHIDHRTEALNKRVYKAEADIERLSRQ